MAEVVTAQRLSSTLLKSQKDNGNNFELTIDDSRSNTLANAFTNKVLSIADLPIIAPDDYIVEVESDPVN